MSPHIVEQNHSRRIGPGPTMSSMNGSFRDVEIPYLSMLFYFFRETEACTMRVFVLAADLWSRHGQVEQMCLRRTHIKSVITQAIA